MSIFDTINNAVSNATQNSVGALPISSPAPQANTPNQSIASRTSITGDGIGPLAPTAVVSSNPQGVNTAQNIIKTTDQQKSQADLAKQNLEALNATTTPQDKFMKGSMDQQNPNYVAPVDTTKQNTQVNPLEQAQTNQILHPGQSQYFNNTTGQEEYLTTPTDGNTPVGYSKSDPTTRTDVSNEIQAPGGTTIKQFSDGTYGRFNLTTGGYSQVSQGDYLQAKDWSDAHTAANNAAKGIYSPSQQNQLDNVMTQYDSLIAKQQFNNANDTGATSIRNALTGMAGQVIGDQQISKSITDGLTKIAEIVSQREEFLAKMKTAFEENDAKALSASFNEYNTSSNEIQKSLNLIQSVTDKAQAKTTSLDASFADSMFKTYGAGILPTDTRQQVMDKLNKNDKFIANTKASASLDTKPSSNGGLSEQGYWSQLSLTDGAKNIVLPGRGMHANDLNVSIMKGIISDAQKMGLSPQDLGQYLVDQKGAADAYGKLKLKEANVDQYATVATKNFENVKRLGDLLTPTEKTTGVPFIDDYLRGGVMKATNDIPLNNYLTGIVSSLTSYSKVLQEATGSAGVTAAMNAEVQDFVKRGGSVESVTGPNGWIEQVAKIEMGNATSSFKGTLSNLDQDMRKIGGNLAYTTSNISGGNGTGLNKNTTAGTTVTSKSGKSYNLPNNIH
jgi:hypothetical protein